MDLALDGLAVLVTGGSGGIGQAVCRAFAAEGARVAVHYHANREAAEKLAAGLPGAVAVGADLTTEDGAAAAVDGTAGVWPAEPAPAWELGLDRWEATLRVDLTAAFLMARAFLRRVAVQGHGNLVFVGSTAALFGEADHADYAAAKAAVVYGLVRSLKNEIVRIAPTGRVNAVCPGWTRTPMTRTALEDPTLLPRATRTMALRKLATAEDVAAQVVLLASDRVAGHVSNGVSRHLRCHLIAAGSRGLGGARPHLGQIVTVAGGMEGRVLHE